MADEDHEKPGQRRQRGGSGGTSSSRGKGSRTGLKLQHGALALGDRHLPLLSGAVHYWRLARDVWEPALREVRDLGLPLVETYVPWSVHETSPGEYDFGERDPRKDLGAFVDLAAELGLKVFLRPGPHINAEMTCFGIPERVIHDRACQARSPQQNPVILPFPPQMFPVPSYASSNFHREVGRWFDAVGRVAGSRMWPQGPIVLLQVDNEAAYYFRNGPYDQDYHPDALALWRKFLEKRHGDLSTVGAAHGRRYETWDDVEPPVRFDAKGPEGLPLHLEWARFQEYLLEHALGRMRRRMARAGMKGVPVVHNVPLGDGGQPISVPALDRTVDLVGFDFYHPAREHRTIKRRSLYLSGTVRTPFAPEMGAGAPPWFTPLSHDDSLYCAMTACGYGLRGFNLYMTVDRDRWYGAPIDSEGTPRVEAGAWKHLVQRLQELQFHRMRRETVVGLIVPREYARLSRATHVLGPVSPSTLEALGGTPVDGCREDPLGFPGPIQVLWWRMLAKVSDALTRAGIPYVYVDSEAPETRLKGMRVLVTPSYEFADPQRWQHLHRAAEQGATIIYGPALPDRDPFMRHVEFTSPPNARRVLLDTPEDADRLVAELATDLELSRPFRTSPSPVDSTLHEDDRGRRVLFVMYPGRERIEAEVELPEPCILRDLMRAEQLEGEHRVRLTLEPKSCRIFEVQPRPQGRGGRGKRNSTPARARRRPS